MCFCWVDLVLEIESTAYVVSTPPTLVSSSTPGACFRVWMLNSYNLLVLGLEACTTISYQAPNFLSHFSWLSLQCLSCMCVVLAVVFRLPLVYLLVTARATVRRTASTCACCTGQYHLIFLMSLVQTGSSTCGPWPMLHVWRQWDGERTYNVVWNPLQCAFE